MKFINVQFSSFNSYIYVITFDTNNETNFAQL